MVDDRLWELVESGYSILAGTDNQGVRIDPLQSTLEFTIEDNEIADLRLDLIQSGREDPSDSMPIEFRMSLYEEDSTNVLIVNQSHRDIGVEVGIIGGDVSLVSDTGDIQDIDVNINQIRQTLVFGRNDSTRSQVIADIRITDDEAFESTETAFISILSVLDADVLAQVNISSTPLTAFITDNDIPATLTLSLSDGYETNQVQKPISLFARLSKVNQSPAPIDIFVDMNGGQAQHGDDFISASIGSSATAKLSIPIGSSITNMVDYFVQNDDILEGDETVEAVIQSLSVDGIVAQSSRVRSTLFDDELLQTEAVIELVNNGKEGEQNAVLQVRLTNDKINGTGSDIDFNLNFVNGSAQSHSHSRLTGGSFDFYDSPSQVSISTGSSFTTFHVSIVDDRIIESTETFSVGISTPSLAGLRISQIFNRQAVMIADNDTATAIVEILQNGYERSPTQANTTQPIQYRIALKDNTNQYVSHEIESGIYVGVDYSGTAVGGPRNDIGIDYLKYL